MDQRGRDWRSVLLLIGAAGGALLAFGAAFVLLASALWGTLSPLSLGGGTSSPLDYLVLASALVAIGAVLVPSVYFGIQRLRGRPAPAAEPRVLRIWQAVLLVVAWVAAAVIAGLMVEKPVVMWITPLLYVVATAIPVYFFFRLAAGGLHPGSEQRLWGVLAGGIGLGILPAVVLELLLAFIAVVAVGVYVGLHPDQLSGLQQLMQQLQNITDVPELVNSIAPWVTSPWVLLAALVFFSVLAPIIEESAKSLAVWSIFDRLQSPAQGFALGAVSGAAFGLVESLLASATADAGWSTTLLVRGASTMMHIMAASLAGWGIAQFRVTRNFGRLLGLYLCAMTLHGLWNAAVVLVAFGSVRTAAAASGLDIAGILLTLLGGALLLVLLLAIPVGMAIANWRFRTALAGHLATVAASKPAAVAPAGDVRWATEPARPPLEEQTAPHLPPDSPPDAGE